MDTYDRLLAFLQRLELNKISYRIEHNRDEAVMVLLAIPGERWEVEFFSDGHLEIEKFRVCSLIEPEEALEELWKLYGDA